MRTPRPLPLLASGGVIAVAVTLALSALRAPAGQRAVAPGACEVTWSLSLGADAADLPQAITAFRGALWAATVNPAAGVGARSAKVRLLQVRDGQRYQEAMTSHAGSADAVSGWIADGAGVHLAVAAGRAVRLLSPLASGPKERAFPQGAADAARDARTPSLAAAREPDGTPTVLARWGHGFAPRRWRLRDTYESPPWMPPRPDRFAAPDLAVVGESLLVAQTRRPGDWSGAGEGPSRVELATLATDPFRAETPRLITLSREGAPGFDPRVALLDPNAPSRGAAVAWRDAMGVILTRVVEEGTWQPREFMRVSDEPGGGVRAVDLASIQGACGTLVAWRRGDALALRAADVTAGRAGPVLTVPGAATTETSRVRAARGGARTFVAFDGAGGPRAIEVTQGADCALTARPLLLPRAFPAGARVAGFDGDRMRAVLAVTDAAPDAAQTPLAFATFDGAGGSVRAAPPAETVAQGVTELSLLDGDVAVVAGRARGSVRLQRVGDRDDDGEAGEDLLLREARGEDLALVASAALRRVWVADVSGPVAAPLRPANAVIVHSAIDGLEDGPRVELPTAEPPPLDAGRITLDAITLSRDGRDVSAWASTASASAGEGCVPGAWAMLRRADTDAALPLRVPGAPWAEARALIPTSDARCGDRVLSVAWRGTHIAAIVRGEAAGVRLVAGDVDAGPPRGVPLERPGAQVLSASVVRMDRGLLALWTVRQGRGAALRYRRFDDDGAPRGEAASLGELLAAEDDARASRMASAATEPGEAATVLATTHGPRVFHVRCGGMR